MQAFLRQSKLLAHEMRMQLYTWHTIAALMTVKQRADALCDCCQFKTECALDVTRRNPLQKQEQEIGEHSCLSSAF